MCFMKKQNRADVVITGMGVVASIGQGKKGFLQALLEGRHAFGVMQRPGRQRESSFLGAEIASLSVPERLSKRLLRTASFSGQAALVALQEAWDDARLQTVDPGGIGLVIGGSNVQQRELVQAYEACAGRSHFVRPTYGLSFMDTDLCGLCTEQFGIKGFAYTAGGASASGQVSVIQAAHAVRTGLADVCIALGALTDLSYLECRGLRSLGAMGSDRYADQPGLACRPFDKNRDGFIYGESCAAVVLELADSAVKRGVTPSAMLSGWAMGADGNRNPNPSREGEARVITKALELAGVPARHIDYVNPHGTGSVVGDETELQALADCGISDARINATKSLVGHGLSAAGAVEIVATVLQMQEARLHPTRNLDDPLEPHRNWVRGQAVEHRVRYALSLSMGFGGINTALCLERW